MVELLRQVAEQGVSGPVPDAVDRGDQARVGRVVGEARGLEAERSVPAACTGPGVEFGQADECPLGLAERRLELFIGAQVEPAAERFLRPQEREDPLLDGRVVRGEAGQRQGVQAFARLHLGARRFGVELDGPVAVGVLELEQALDVGLDLGGEPGLVHRAEPDGLRGEVARVGRLAHG